MAAQEHTPWADKAASLYDDAYARRYRAHDEELDASVPSQLLAAWLREICGRFDAPIDALDLGCGTGRYFWALQGVRTLVGVDASAAMLEEAKRPFRAADVTVETITLQQGDVLTRRFDPAAFDLVYSIGVLAEHAPLTRELVERVRGWLRPGGRFAFTTVHPASPSIPVTFKRRLATIAAPVVPALRARLLSGGMYADESFVRAVAAPGFTIETMDRFTSEAHLHVRAVLRKGAR